VWPNKQKDLPPIWMAGAAVQEGLQREDGRWTLKEGRERLGAKYDRWRSLYPSAGL
jgi:hypothetical protein